MMMVMVSAKAVGGGVWAEGRIAAVWRDTREMRPAPEMIVL